MEPRESRPRSRDEPGRTIRPPRTPSLEGSWGGYFLVYLPVMQFIHSLPSWDISILKFRVSFLPNE